MTDDYGQVEDVGTRQELSERVRVNERGVIEPTAAFDKLATSPEDGAAKTRKADPRERREQIETTDVRLGFMRCCMVDYTHQDCKLAHKSAARYGGISFR